MYILLIIHIITGTIKKNKFKNIYIFGMFKINVAAAKNLYNYFETFFADLIAN